MQRERKNKGLRGFVHQPRAEKTGKGGPGTAQVGAPLPAKPCISVTRRQHFALRRLCPSAKLAPHCRQSLMPPLRGANILPWSAARTPAELAPHCRQSLVPPLRGANILLWSAAGHRPSWRSFARKALCLRYGAPTFYPEARPAAGKVRARFPAKPINSVFVREPRWLRRAESRSGRRFGSRSAARKANKFGFCARTPVPRRAESRPAGRHLQLIRRPPKNNKKTSNLSCSSMVRDQGFEPWTP